MSSLILLLIISPGMANYNKRETQKHNIAKLLIARSLLYMLSINIT